MSQITFTDIIELYQTLGNSHVDIQSNYRWNFTEFDGDVRENTNYPLMTYEAPDVEPDNIESSPLLNFTTAFNILGMQDVDTSDATDEEAQNQVLNNSLEIALEVIRKINEICATFNNVDNTKNKWYGLFKKLSFTLTKVGPVTNSYLYGYRCELTFNPKFHLQVDESKWN